MSRFMNTVPVSAHPNQRLAIQGDTLYYAGISRVHFDELQQLLSRGSGQVVRGGKRGKIWFQAQCAHYGLPTENTLATLRLKLEESLESGKVYMEENARRVEQGFRAVERRPHTLPARPAERPPTPAARSVTPVAPSPELAQSHEGATTAIATQAPPQTPIRTRPRALHVDSSNAIHLPLPPYSFLPTPISRPRARDARRDPDSPTPTNRGGTSTGIGRNDPIAVPAARGLDLAPPPYYSGSSQPRENPGRTPRLERDVVSGQWELLVTRSPRALSRVVASKRRRGEVDVHLSSSRESLTAEFALFGLDGIIESERLETNGRGVCASVKFVAQIPGGTNYDDTITLGPSEDRCGYLKFEAGKINGTLSCPQYGKLEFEGVRVGAPRPLCGRWSDWL